jgi:FKBP-type peptidyl-prolyl cis-trans isomerase
MPRPLVASVLALTLVACGGARPAPAAEPTPAPVAQAEAPCAVWSADADPTATPVDVARAPEQARRSISGLRWCVLREGDGAARPAATDTVTVHYTGWTTDGAMFDSSRTRGAPSSFPLNGVIAGWTEGVQLMSVGEVRRFWIPESLAYGGRPGAPQGMLVFDNELLSID